ncbi:SOS response-associated peptidase [Aspergillus clavatus NRRL 1]|uniref:DUF159 domain protein n=1 Tax=Aspergillus clavatus (strain ATCC 1007 / CBS 513.65 / DSM 816 / NCTC 3887 / NRRL 1 / QM 1276 / 107) TaxID=344612 RepID=A1CIN6_ASPCL|nr:DUF159 domain protein [Aspergillus clavatus NRRL 1]EAW10741.1 DUF159 domain protein [Aspergillus clavatus NRRL 1]
MCGRYALGVRMAYIRRHLQEQGMEVDEVPDEDAVRETYNFAPGYNGAVYRADVSDRGLVDDTEEHDSAEHSEETPADFRDEKQMTHDKKLRYKIQSMRWGLIPFWMKRQPDYGSLMRTINCRDDSLIEDRGMWTSMKRKKRCIVICQGFYEWLKKGPGGKEKVPHYIKRKDGELMCFAGLWDCVSYEGSDEKLYTYTFITTSSNAYLKFLHDRMPVILEPNSKAMQIWLDPSRTTWSSELQSILKPYEGELECYPVSKDVGKVGNNSPDFIIPVNSKDNKSNIANFFANAKKPKEEPGISVKVQEEDTKELLSSERKVVKDQSEERKTQDDHWSEDNAPIPGPGVKREHPPDGDDMIKDVDHKKQKTEPTQASFTKKGQLPRPTSKQQAVSSTRKTRSATQNDKPMKKTNAKRGTDGSQRITNFFQK